MKGFWFSELQVPGMAIYLEADKKIYEEKTDFQYLEVFNSKVFGKVMVLDGCIMTTDKDEFVYHEMITHIPLNTHPNPENVLVVGGGDGGAIREIIKHPKVKKATLVEIDEGVVRASKEYFPQISCGLDDPKVEVKICDGIKHIAESKGQYDIILVDSTDPVGPAVGLFESGFYKGIYDALKDDGIFVAQTESPFVNENIVPGIFGRINDIFPITKMYLAYIPTYPGSMWSFTMGSKKHDPLAVKKEEILVSDTKYYTKDIHYAAFQLPKFVQDMLKEK